MIKIHSVRIDLILGFGLIRDTSMIFGAINKNSESADKNTLLVISLKD